MNLDIQPSLSSKPLTTPSLESLLATTAAGDRAAFAELYRLTHRRLYAIALALTRQPEAAEDILQETYLAIWRTAGQYQARRAPALVWLMAIVRHRAIEFLRQRRRRLLETWAEPLTEDALQMADPQALQPTDPIARAIHECLQRLPPKQARLIGLAFFYGFSHEELAAQRQMPLGTIKSWVRRGLLQLKECLET